MKKYLLIFMMVLTPALKGSGIEFILEYPKKDIAGSHLKGRALLFLSKNNLEEPRFQINDKESTAFVFGIDINTEKASTAIIDNKVFGYPVERVDQVPSGEYYVQGLLHKYDTFNLKTGHTVNLPMDKGEGQRWHSAPGNYYSKVKKISLDHKKIKKFRVTLDQIVPEITPPVDTKYIKHIKIESKLLSDFWGRPMHLGAHVLLPEGFDEHPEAKYPLMIFHGHFPKDFGGFRTSPPDPDLEPDYSERFQLEGYNRIVQEHEYQFYKDWTSEDYPRVVAIEIQHANPYYDDSYAVNSANLGPYGDAITYELIPYIEKQFRCIGEGWSRFLYGGSTGGWEALAAQVFYPDEYNGCYAACPDPIDFRAYCLVDIYKDKNAYHSGPKHRQVERPGHRNYLGQVSASLRQMNYRELALGVNSRSGEQWDIWQAVYSPMGPDGYPKPIWDKLTGEIDPEVAAYWKENYDLRYILKRDWHSLGSRLEGKINIYCGDMDNYYLNNAVYLMEDFLESTKKPYYNGHVDYGDRAEHCWNGDHSRPNATSRLRYHQMFIDKAVERMYISAPKNADLSSWRY